MLRIGILDDIEEIRFTLRGQLERILELRGIECALYEFSTGDRLMEWHEKNAGILDILFLDIEMHGTNGMDTAKSIRKVDGAVQMIFVTGHRDYVFDGYEVGALGYLLKPPEDAALDRVLTRALVALHMDAENVFICRNGEGVYRIPKSSIHYFFSEKRKVTCVTAARKYDFYARLDQVEAEVGNGFVRVHQRYLVNASAVQRIAGETVEVGEAHVPISRAYRKEAILALTQAMLT